MCFGYNDTQLLLRTEKHHITLILLTLISSILSCLILLEVWCEICCQIQLYFFSQERTRKANAFLPFQAQLQSGLLKCILLNRYHGKDWHCKAVSNMKKARTYRCFIDAEGIWSHSSKEFTIMTPSKQIKRKKTRALDRNCFFVKWSLGLLHSTLNLFLNLLKNRPVSWVFTVESPLLLPSQNIPDDNSLRVILCIHQRAEGH